MDNNIIILAGGIGSRLWPLSRPDFPKQFLSFDSEKSLLQLTVERAVSISGNGQIFIITSEDNSQQVEKEVIPFTRDSINLTILSEPERKNTAAAILLGIAKLKKSSTHDLPCLVMASDHMITPLNSFITDVKQSYGQILSQRTTSLKNRSVFLFGIPPTRPETGFGYIQTKRGKTGILKVRSFKEKPDLKLARKYYRNSCYWWNSGMFHFDIQHFLYLYEKYAPELFKAFSLVLDFADAQWADEGTKELIVQAYKQSPKAPIDKAVIEKTKTISMIPVNFKWSDVGGWNDVSDLFRDSSMNSLKCQIEGKNNFSITSKQVTFCGVDDIIVVENENDILVTRRNKAHLLKVE